MVLWRISRHRDLSGIGGLKAGWTLASCRPFDRLPGPDTRIGPARSLRTYKCNTMCLRNLRC